MRKWKSILVISLVVITLFAIFQGLVYLYAFVPWAVPWVGDIIIANPSKPGIKYGEFPFRLTYELNGEVKVIEDTIICEFDGYEIHGEAGKYRKWNFRLKSGSERVTLLDTSELGIEDRWGNQVLELYFNPGNAEYYMNDDIGRNKISGGISNSVDYMYRTVDGRIGFSTFFAEEAYEKYKIRLLSWEPSKPIQNSFK